MANFKTYSITDFLNDLVNISVFTEQIEAEGLTVGLTHINSEEVDSVLQVTPFFDGDLQAADITALDSLVAAHTGADFTPGPFEDIDEKEAAPGTDDSGDEVMTVHIDSIMPEPGRYQLWAYQELATTTTDGNTIAKGRLHVTKNGTKKERGEGHNDQHLFQGMFVGFPFTVKAGDVYSFELTYERQGPSGNAARYQRARIAVEKKS